jgi:DNA-binding MurR/RpiR family transcriptional regulator
MLTGRVELDRIEEIISFLRKAHEIDAYGGRSCGCVYDRQRIREDLVISTVTALSVIAF